MPKSKSERAAKFFCVPESNGRLQIVPEKLTIGLVQRRRSTHPAENLTATLAAIREAAGRGAKIVCLEELFRSQYFCREEKHDRFDLAEAIPGSSTEALGKLAKELRV